MGTELMSSKGLEYGTPPEENSVLDATLITGRNTTVPATDLRLGYLLITSPAANVLMGSVMITDGRGLPQAFHHTDPIQPTRIQQVLYGQVLNQYLKTEVILGALLEPLNPMPDILFVEDDTLLDADLNSLLNGTTIKGVLKSRVRPVPKLVRLANVNGDPIGPMGSVEIPGTLEQPSNTERLFQHSRDGGPLRLSLAPQTEVFDWDGLLATLSGLGESMDLCEPMRRIEKALEMLTQEAGVGTSHASNSQRD